MGSVLPFAATAAGTLAVSTIVQLWVVPAVETRKRREARWEVDALALGESLAFDLSDATGNYIAALRKQVVMRRVPDRVDAERWREATHEVETEVRAAFDGYQRASARADWLLEKLVRHEMSSQQARRAKVGMMVFRVAASGLVYRAEDKPTTDDEISTAQQRLRDALETVETYATEALHRPAGSISRPVRERAARLRGWAENTLKRSDAKSPTA